MRTKGIVLILFVGVIAIGIFLWSKKKATDLHSKPQSQEQFDREVLKKKNSESGEVYGALVRLSKDKTNNEVLKEAFKRYRSSEDKLREASALAFGNFSGPEVDLALKELIQDKNPQVRMQAIVALSTTPNPERVKMLEGILEKKDSVSAQDQITALYARYVVSPDMNTFEKTKSKLLAMGSDSKLSPEDRVQALNRMAALVPKDPKLVSLLQSFLSNNSKAKDGALEQLAIRHLTYIRSENFYSQAASLYENGSPTTRMTLLQVLPQICHSSKWKIVETAAKHSQDRNLEWKTTLTQLSMVSFDEAKPHFETLKRNQKFSEADIKEMDRVVALQKTRSDRNPCQ